MLGSHCWWEVAKRERQLALAPNKKIAEHLAVQAVHVLVELKDFKNPGLEPKLQAMANELDSELEEAGRRVLDLQEEVKKHRDDKSAEIDALENEIAMLRQFVAKHAAVFGGSLCTRAVAWVEADGVVTAEEHLRQLQHPDDTTSSAAHMRRSLGPPQGSEQHVAALKADLQV